MRPRAVTFLIVRFQQSFPWLCALLWLFLLTISASAQTQYRFDHWTTDNGLPQNTVRSLVQTRDGYLWFTTFDGLVRFDGVRFTVLDKNNTPGLVSNRFVEIKEDKNGTLYALTEEGSLSVYRHGVFTSYTQANDPSGSIARNLKLDANGEMIIGLEGNLRAYLRDGKFIPAPHEYQVGTMHSFYIGPSGHLWTLDPQGVNLHIGERVIHYPNIFNDANNGINFAAYEDHRGNLWIGTPAGLYRLSDGVITRFTEKDGLPSRAYMRPYVEDNDGGIWFIVGGARSSDNRLARFKGGHFTFFSPESSLPEADIGQILVDREGTIWIGTSIGLYRARKQLITTYSIEHGLAGREVYPLLQTRNGDILIGTTLGMSLFRDGQFTKPIGKLGELTFAQALFEDARGRIWAGHIGGMGWFENGQFKEGPSQLLETVSDVHSDRNGNIWVAAALGVFKFNDDKIIASYRTQEGLPGNDVKVIHESTDGSLWFGAYGGLACLKDGQLKVWTTKDGLASDYVRSIYEDADGTLWIGTYDGGLSRFRDNKFFNYTIDNGLFSNGVFAILEDKGGNFWISCNKGIYRVRRQDLNNFADGKIAQINSIAYGKSDGMRSAECNGGRQPAGLIANDGKMWFPTQNGVAVVDPDAVIANPLLPPVEFESIAIDRDTIAFTDSVQINPSQTTLDITYTALSLINSNLIRFKYKMEGLDPDWIDVGTRRTAYYSYLPPGKYTFKVIAANSDGIWNNEGKAITVIVIPPFYRTWWFIVLISLSVLGAAFGVYKYRVTQLRKVHETREAFSQQLLESQEAFARQLIDSQEVERKRIAAELHDSLGQNLLIIKNRLMMASLTSKDVDSARQQFNDITASTTQAIEEVRQIAYNLRPYHLDNLGLTNSLEAMIDKVENSTGIRFSYDIATMDGLLSQESEINLYRIVQEAINNIVKHSQATHANIEITRDEHKVYISITDDGKGFETKAITEAVPGHGFGLTGIAERVRMLGGTFNIDSTVGSGTTITVEVALQHVARDNNNESRNNNNHR